MKKSLTTIYSILFLIFLGLGFESKAVDLAALPSTVSDTCVEINFKDGDKIIGKIVKKVNGKVYFKKCGNLKDTTSYFVPEEKIEAIKPLKKVENKVKSEKSEQENKAAQSRIWILFTVSLVSMLLMLIIPYAGSIFLISTVLGFYRSSSL